MSAQQSDTNNTVNVQTIKMLQLFPVRKIQCLQFDMQKYRKLYDLLTCTFCRQIFNNPTYLKCSHRFCKECIQKYIRLNDKKSCPVCRGQLTTKRDSKADLKLISLISFAFGDATSMQEEINRCQEQTLKALKFVKTRNGIQMELKRNRAEYMETRSKCIETPIKKRSKRDIQEESQQEMFSKSKDNTKIIQEKSVTNQNKQKQKNINAQTQGQVQNQGQVKIQGNPETDSKVSSNSKKSGKSGVGWGNTRTRNPKKNQEIIQIFSQGSQDAPLEKSVDKSIDKSVSKSMSNIEQSITFEQKSTIPTSSNAQILAAYQKYNKNDPKNEAKYLRSISQKILQIQSQNQANQSQLLYQPISRPVPSSSYYFQNQTPSSSITSNMRNPYSYSSSALPPQPQPPVLSSTISPQFSVPPTPLVKTPQILLFQANSSIFPPSLLTIRNKLQQFLTPEQYLPTLIQKYYKKISIKVIIKPNPNVKSIIPVPWGLTEGVQLSLKTTIGNIQHFILNKINKSIFSQLQRQNIKIQQIIQISINPQNAQQSSNKKQQQQLQLITIKDNNMTVLNILEKYWHNFKDIQFFNIKNSLNLTQKKQKQNRQLKILYYTIKYDSLFKKM